MYLIWDPQKPAVASFTCQLKIYSFHLLVGKWRSLIILGLNWLKKASSTTTANHIHIMAAVSTCTTRTRTQYNLPFSIHWICVLSFFWFSVIPFFPLYCQDVPILSWVSTDCVQCCLLHVYTEDKDEWAEDPASPARWDPYYNKNTAPKGPLT